MKCGTSISEQQKMVVYTLLNLCMYSEYDQDETYIKLAYDEDLPPSFLRF